MRQITGDVGENRDRLLAFIGRQGIELYFTEKIAPALGMSYGGRIAILSGQSKAEEFSTIVHELAHEMLHKAERHTATTRVVRETEAEAIAFVVSKAVGLEAGTASADYIHLYHDNASLLAESLEVIQQTLLSSSPHWNRRMPKTRKLHWPRPAEPALEWGGCGGCAPLLLSTCAQPLERSRSIMNTAAEYRDLPLNLLTESTTNPRRVFDDAPLRELAESIRAQGVLSPLLVRPLTFRSGKRYGTRLRNRFAVLPVTQVAQAS